MKKYIISPFVAILFISPCSIGQTVTTMPSFKVNLTSRSSLNTPTSDKPQSKLCYMDSQWWAIIADSFGPAFFQRTPSGWKRHEEVSKRLKGVPGRADVWYEDRQVTAVGISDSTLYVYRLAPDKSSSDHWRVLFSKPLKIPQNHPKIETATIAKDAAGIWWVAADVGERAMYVWSSKNARRWNDPVLVAEGMAPDDICSIVSLKNAVMIIWSDQKAEAVYCREHKNGDPADRWSAVQTVESGNSTADDHINTAVSADGTLWVNTKNEVDSVGFPNLVLRVRKPDGTWRNFPYAILTKDTGPSRPVVITTPDPNLILSGYTIYDHTNKKRYRDRIAFGMIDTSSNDIMTRTVEVIVPDTSLQVMVNNITGPKSAFPKDGPWIILASDRKGNIYEADLRPFFDKPVR